MAACDFLVSDYRFTLFIFQRSLISVCSYREAVCVQLVCADRGAEIAFPFQCVLPVRRVEEPV